MNKLGTLHTHPSAKGLLVMSLVTLLLGSACENYFGDKTDLSFIDKPVFQDRNIAYVPILPVLDNFSYPVDILAGFDELIYVVDAATEEIVQLDQSGRELQRLKVPGVQRIAQDRKLDLLAIGTYDTTLRVQVGGAPRDSSFSLSCVYRINQRNNGFLQLALAKPELAVLNPFYFKSNFSFNDAEVRFTSLACLHDNSYYIAQDGPRSSDDKIILIASEVYARQLGLENIVEDNYVSPIIVQAPTGIEREYFKDPRALVTLAQPPQSFNMPGSRDFIFASGAEATALKVQYIRFVESADGSVFNVEALIEGDTTQADRFLYTPNRFTSPSALAFTGDGSNYLFVLDSEKDSLYQFTNTGLEGVKPPAAASSQKHVLASFGGRGSGINQFNNPMGLAYLNRIVYVADAGNGRILRYRLTIDFD